MSCEVPYKVAAAFESLVVSTWHACAYVRECVYNIMITLRACECVCTGSIGKAWAKLGLSLRL